MNDKKIFQELFEVVMKQRKEEDSWVEVANAFEDALCDEYDEEEEEIFPMNNVYKPQVKKKRGRPKKNSVASGHEAVVLGVVANGYMVTVGDGAQNTFVFKNLDEVNEWMKDNMHPTFKNAQFMEAL